MTDSEEDNTPDKELWSVQVRRLVRDNMEPIMKEKGLIGTFRIHKNPGEMTAKVKSKLSEEYWELQRCRSIKSVIDKLADILEILLKLCSIYNIVLKPLVNTPDKIEKGNMMRELIGDLFKTTDYNKISEIVNKIFQSFMLLLVQRNINFNSVVINMEEKAKKTGKFKKGVILDYIHISREDPKFDQYNRKYKVKKLDNTTAINSDENTTAINSDEKAELIG